MKIKNIIFDFGGVLYDINYSRCSEELAKLSSKPEIFDNLTLEEFIEVSSDFEKGIMNERQFRDLFRTGYFINADDKIFDNAWNSMLIELKDDSIHLIKQLKSEYRISLLSNSNQIHYNYFYNDCKVMFDNFEKLFFSFQLGMKKPDPEIYKFVCKKMKYLPEETLFVDDNSKNIECAILAGLNTFLYSSEKKLSDILHSIKNITHIYNV